MRSITTPLIALIVLSACEVCAEPPCDHYPIQKQQRCEAHWKQINDEAVGEMVEFGSTQLKRREAGTITPEQHLQQNMEFIKHSAEKRLKLLSKRMSQDNERDHALTVLTRHMEWTGLLPGRDRTPHSHRSVSIDCFIGLTP